MNTPTTLKVEEPGCGGNLQREQAAGLWPDLPPVQRCRVARLKRADGLRGVTRGKVFRTTPPDPATVRPPDRVGRDFTAILSSRHPVTKLAEYT